MHNLIISLILLFSVSPLALATADIPLQDNPPDKHVVVRGDTLWGIAGNFLKEPWRWPELWNLNREQVKNPHLIYPGDVIVLTLVNGKPRLQLAGKQSLETVRLSPSMRSEYLSPESRAIPSISPSIIAPFLGQPLVIEERFLDGAPSIVRAEEGRVIIGAGNSAYAIGLEKTSGIHWSIYRPGKILSDPDTGEILGQEAIYLGKAKVIKFGEPSTIEITESAREINAGDRLVPVTDGPVNAYVPRAPERFLTGSIISAYGGVAEAGRHNVVTLNRGKRDGIEIGHVLAIYRRGGMAPIVNGQGDKATLAMPDERSGLIFVFRVFDRLSYALVVQSNRPVHMLDIVQTP
jgi:hypothetical protein